MTHKLLCIAALAAASSCATVRVTGPQPAEAQCAVSFHRLGPPAEAYREVGSALVEGSVFLSPADAEGELREKACAAGADGVVVTREIYGVPMLGSLVQAVFIQRT